ncbi:hypothetical protein [Streptomyces sp. H27-D2]|uniref:hypothetical protein n=1 Tax=Streptomyces sp. H27-D2 TaxID=3046304 RepID=UPI002DC015FB|nr:hypothetical protein [Streptomyces sp. H27-D2]MEC4015464.1 hypothetical protein [Streptomyces sp. H27-D2]
MPSPIAAASALINPSRRTRLEDPLISWVQRVRTALGLVAMAWLLLAYPVRKEREDFVFGKLEELLIGCGIIMVAGIIGVSFFIFAARPPLGRMYAGRLTGPLCALAAVPLGAGLAWLAVAGLKGDIISPSNPGSHDFLFGLFGDSMGKLISGLAVILLLIVGALACVVILVVAVCFTLAAAIAGMNSCFRAGDVHELLPALLSPLLVWSLFGLQLFDGADVAAPPAVIYAFSLGGPLSVSALSVWEVRRLRNRHGVTLRSALGRQLGQTS